jgi:hypothetical protein
VRDAVKGLWRVLGGGHREQRVRQRAAAGGAARRVRHAGGVGVDAHDQRLRPRSSDAQHAPAVAGSEVDGDAGVAGPDVFESADVDVDEAAALNRAQHGASFRRHSHEGVKIVQRGRWNRPPAVARSERN